MHLLLHNIAYGSLTSINQTWSVDISSSVFYWVVRLQNKGEVAGVILLLCVINFRFTVKKWLKSVYIYGRYSKNKTGVPLFGPPCITGRVVGSTSWWSQVVGFTP